MSDKTLSESMFFQAHEETKQTLAQLNKKMDKLEQQMEAKNQPSARSESNSTEIVAGKEAREKDEKAWQRFTDHYWKTMSENLGKAISPLSAQVCDLQTKFAEASKPRKIIKLYRLQWVKSRGVLTIIALVLSLFSALYWGFTAQHQAQEDIAYRNIFRVARAYHGASVNGLQYLRTVFLEQGHDKERVHLLEYADRYEARWNAMQDSLIQVREAKKIK